MGCVSSKDYGYEPPDDRGGAEMIEACGKHQLSSGENSQRLGSQSGYETPLEGFEFAQARHPRCGFPDYRPRKSGVYRLPGSSGCTQAVWVDGRWVEGRWDPRRFGEVVGCNDDTSVYGSRSAESEDKHGKSGVRRSARPMSERQWFARGGFWKANAHGGQQEKSRSISSVCEGDTVDRQEEDLAVSPVERDAESREDGEA